MTSGKIDFFLGSREHIGEWEIARACRKRDFLSGPRDAEYLWISVTPPVKGPSVGASGDLADLIIGPHFVGDSLRRRMRFPFSVYIYRILNPDVLVTLAIQDGDVELAAWGELYRTLREAEGNT